MLNGKQIRWIKSVDWTLKNVTKGNQETFLSTHPMDWNKTASLGCQQSFLQFVLLSLWLSV